MTESEQRMYDAAKAQIEKMREDFREIANYSDAVKAVLAYALADAPEESLIRLTMDKIIEIAEAHT